MTKYLFFDNQIFTKKIKICFAIVKKIISDSLHKFTQSYTNVQMYEISLNMKSCTPFVYVLKSSKVLL